METTPTSKSNMDTRDRADRHLGSGLRFPLVIEASGRLGLCDGRERVRQSIHLILSTAKGERVMRPDFGCDIHDFVFTAISSTTLRMIRSAVREALVQWEPRIEVDDVEVATDELKEGLLSISIRYRERSTNFESNLVYPFYINPGGDTP